MLKRKMLRDIHQNLAQFITIFLMVLIGIMVYTGIQGYSCGMVKTANRFYDQNNLQDLNVLGRNFSTQDLTTIKKLDRVKDAERKLTLTATSHHKKLLFLNFIESNRISRFHVVSGEAFDYHKAGVWLDEFYAAKNNYQVGDKILIKTPYASSYQPILGIVNIPDHLYDTKDSSEIFSDHSEFGVAYLSAAELPVAMRNFNNIMVDVDAPSQTATSSGYSESSNKVKAAIESKVSSALAVSHIEDSVSYQAYQGEIEEGEAYVGVFSGLFLLIAALSVATTMTRMIKKQRTQIGTLKALGFKNSRVSLHLISYNFFISLIAAVVGLILGYVLIGHFFISMQMQFFAIPNGAPVMAFSDYFVAFIAIMVVSLIAWFACRKILRENPAETLRVERPSSTKQRIKILPPKLTAKLSFASKWNLRDISRNKIRTTMGIAGITGCCLLITSAFGVLDSINHFINLQFHQLSDFTYKLSLSEDLTPKQSKQLTARYGSNSSDTIPIEIVHQGTRTANNILVTDAQDSLRFIDQFEKNIPINRDDGVYVTYKLAEKNGYRLGDHIKWHSYGSKKLYHSKIVGFRRDPQNQNITMTRAYLESLGLKYQPDAIYTHQDLSSLQTSKMITAVHDIAGLEANMNDMLSTMRSMVVVLISIAALLGIVIIYNISVLSYTEKQYQFATLKVLGFKDRQIKKIFVKQNNWIALVSALIGLPLGYLIVEWIFTAVIEDSYDLHAFIQPTSYLLAFFGTLTMSYLVSKLLARKIKSVDMVSSLKGNE